MRLLQAVVSVIFMLSAFVAPSAWATGKDDCPTGPGVIETIYSMIFPKKALPLAVPTVAKGAQAGPLVKSWINGWKSSFSLTTVSHGEYAPVLDWMANELKQIKSSEAQSALRRITALREKGETDPKTLLVAVGEAAEVFKNAFPPGDEYAKLATEQLSYLKGKLEQAELGSYLGTYRVTEKELTVREINDLSPYPIYPVGITAKPSYADGTPKSSLGFMIHDVAHGVLNAEYKDRQILALIKAGDAKGAQVIIAENEKIYADFRALVASTQSQKQKELMELFWFDLFHERSKSISRSVFSEAGLGYGTDDMFVKRILRRFALKGDFEMSLSMPASEITKQDLVDAMNRMRALANP